MKERPILFSGPMVLAILEERKTQTRRIVKEPVLSTAYKDNELNFKIGERYIKCPYGQVGDRLWVRETFRYISYTEGYDSGVDQGGGHDWGDGYSFVQYKSDSFIFRYELLEEDYLKTSPVIDRWYPSIHMPRWASRILLEITDIRVERLKDITEEDAKAEGIENKSNHFHLACTQDFKRLWESINGLGSWYMNPWVWVVEFRRIG